MAIRKDIIVGDKVDLRVEDGDICPVLVGDVLSNGIMLVTLPTIKGIMVPLHTGVDHTIYFYRETGRYSITAKCLGHETVNDVRFAKFQQVTKPEKEQRREYFRLNIKLKIEVFKFEGDLGEVDEDYLDEDDELIEVTLTNDISVAGVSALMKEPLDHGTQLHVRIYSNWPNEKAKPFEAIAEVRRTIYQAERGNYLIGMRFLLLSEQTRELIAKFVVLQQQRQIKQRRLVEDA